MNAGTATCLTMKRDVKIVRDVMDAQSIVMRHMTHLMETTGVPSVLKQSVVQTITYETTTRTDELKKLVLKATVNKQTRRR
jgi:hypothetical protein